MEFAEIVLLAELVEEYEPELGVIQYKFATPLPESLADTVNAPFTYFPTVEVDAPLIVGREVSTLN